METAYVATGQLVIPVKIRRRHGIKPGTRINFIEEPNGRIVLQPVTREYIHSFCGIFQRKPDSKPVTQQLAEEHAEENHRRGRLCHIFGRLFKGTSGNSVSSNPHSRQNVKNMIF